MPLKIVLPPDSPCEALLHTDACVHIAPPSRLKLHYDARCRTGHAILLKSSATSAPRTILAAIPLYFGGLFGEAEKLRTCCLRALNIAKRNHFESITISLHTRGRFGFPAEKARSLLVSVIGKWLAKNDSDMDITLLCAHRALEKKAAARLKDYIYEQRFNKDIRLYKMASTDPFPPASFSKAASTAADERCCPLGEASDALTDDDFAFDGAPASYEECDCAPPPASFPPLRKQRRLEDVLREVGESFSQMLFRLIDQRGLTDPEVYKRANMDRRLFSKIRSNPRYQPAKGTVLSLAIALELNLDQTADLLRRAGFALSPSSVSDLIVEYFIREKNFNIHEINEALFAFKQKLLGS